MSILRAQKYKTRVNQTLGMENTLDEINSICDVEK